MRRLEQGVGQTDIAHKKLWVPFPFKLQIGDEHKPDSSQPDCHQYDYDRCHSNSAPHRENYISNIIGPAVPRLVQLLGKRCGVLSSSKA